MNQSEMQSLADPINRLLERAGGAKLPMERLTPANFIEMVQTITDVVCPPQSEEPEDDGKVPILNESGDVSVELAARMRGNRARQPTRKAIESAKRELIDALPGRGRK